jgi:hypothetical protein
MSSVSALNKHNITIWQNGSINVTHEEYTRHKAQENTPELQYHDPHLFRSHHMKHPIRIMDIVTLIELQG